ncbi:MAG: hypothetical protein VR72_01915 [Clostridiaceae bacterium BRH_c20a]|nr:MAG: hypothetical protein VR72_01915 [Clostridiaceae bacterium BRH_c20a]
MEQAALDLKSLLTDNKDTLLTKWFHLVLETYPKETARHFGNQKSQFANPIGHNIFEGLDEIYDELSQYANEDRIFKALDRILRITAVQDLSPSKAVSFLFLLKRVVREGLAEELREGKCLQELLDFEDKVDQSILLAFNIYLECRETIYKMRLHEVKTRCDILERINQYNN